MYQEIVVSTMPSPFTTEIYYRLSVNFKERYYWNTIKDWNTLFVLKIQLYNTTNLFLYKYIITYLLA